MLMKWTFLLLLFFFGVDDAGLQAQPNHPLSAYSAEWNQPRFADCRPAPSAGFLRQEEYQLIWTLNLIRRDPRLFLQSVLLNPASRHYVPASRRTSYHRSLIDDLRQRPSIRPVLVPDSLATQSARCHARWSGKQGYVGHDRDPSCPPAFDAECCDYGNRDALSILVHLLIDEDVPSLGHRIICLSGDYRALGVAIEAHTRYRYNTVLDFRRN